MSIESLWVFVLAFSGPVAAVVLFATHVLQVKKLQLELDKLKDDKKQRESLIVIASIDEIRKYGKGSLKIHAIQTGVLIVALLSVAPLLIELGKDSMLGVPFSASGSSSDNNKLWAKNIDCAREGHFIAAPAEFAEITVAMLVCPSGDILVRVTPKNGHPSFQWIEGHLGDESTKP